MTDCAEMEADSARDTERPEANAALYKAACCVMGLDGVICAAGSPLLGRLAQRGGLAGELDTLLARVADDHAFYTDQLAVLTAEPEVTIASILRVAGEDGTLADEDRVAVRHLADRLGVDSTRTEDVLRSVRRELGIEGDS